MELVLEPDLPRWYLNQVMEHDWEAEDLLRQRGSNVNVWFISCQRLLENRGFWKSAPTPRRSPG